MRANYHCKINDLAEGERLEDWACQQHMEPDGQQLRYRELVLRSYRGVPGESEKEKKTETTYEGGYADLLLRAVD